MISKTAIAAALISLSTLVAVPAQAGATTVELGFGGHGWSDHGGGRGHRDHRRHDRLTTDEVRWILRDRGYRSIRFVDNRGAVYQLRARKRGSLYFMVVSARTGEILSRNRF